jgi:hypothetical protein
MCNIESVIGERLFGSGCCGALRSDNFYEQLHNGTRVFIPKTVENENEESGRLFQLVNYPSNRRCETDVREKTLVSFGQKIPIFTPED